MKAIFTLILFLNFSIASLGQNSDSWSSFYNSDSSLIGFKDAAGNVKIAPKYSELTRVSYFDNVIVVFDSSSDNKFRPHFLTKSGKNFGYDIVYFFDNMPDCENEGFIRFQDHHSDKMELFNREGRVVIPANYNYISLVKNGFVVALKNAKKMTDGEHFYYQGGQTILLDTNNVILSQDTILQHIVWDKINFYSFKKSLHKINDNLYVNIQTTDGNYYSFINYESEFKQWFFKTYLPNRTKESIIDSYSFPYIINYNSDSKNYVKIEPNKFFSIYKNPFLSALSTINKLADSCTIVPNEMNYFPIRDALNNTYYNNCGEDLNNGKYPTFTVYATNQNDVSRINYIVFIRTDSDYKLFYASLRQL